MADPDDDPYLYGYLKEQLAALEESMPAASREVYLPYQIRDDRTLEAVLKLPVHYRNAIYLFYYEDYSIQEIAGVLNEKEGTIKTRLRRGREEVKKILTEGRPENL